MANPEIVMSSPATVETAEFHFILVKRCQAINLAEKPSYANMVVVANTSGLTFIGKKQGFIVAKTNSFAESQFPHKFQHVRCQLVTHLAVNCDETFLIAGGSTSDGCLSYVYDLNSITRDSYLLGAHKVILSSTPGVVICDMVWNPTVPHMLSACLSDGTVVIVEFKGSSFEINSLAVGARCLCWSPKGKQLVVGGVDGKLTQHRPDLTTAKTLPAPALFGGSASVVSVLWISNFQFAAYYCDSKQPDVSPVLVIVNAGKNEPITFINYDDVTYGSTGFRFPQFYFHHIPAWNTILISSANSVEVAVLHLASDGKTWEQWVVGDSSRAEMPLSADQDETYPLGMALDLSSQSRVPWPQAETELPPMPRLLLLSNEGRLCIYNVVSLRQDTPFICAAPSQVVDDKYFDTVNPNDKSSSAVEEIPPITSQPAETFSPVVLATPTIPSAPAKVAIQQTTLTSPQPLQQAPLPTAPPHSSSSSTTIMSSQPPANRQVVPPIKEDILPPPAPPPTSVPSPASPTNEPEPEPEVDDSVYNAAIFDEVAALNEQLSSLQAELSYGISELGSEEQFSDVVNRLESLAEFQRDVEDTTKSQAEEVVELKLESLELTAKAEDARLVNSRHGNKLTTQLRRNEQLDPVMARTQREILSLRTYIENQLGQVANHLDRQWEEYQLSCRKDAKDRMETPRMEDIFKTLDLQKKLICWGKGELDRLHKEVEQRTLKAKFPILTQRPISREHDTSRSAELSKLADSLLGMTIQTDERMRKEEVSELVIESKRKNLSTPEFTVAEITLLLDRFEDADVPQLSHALNFAEREAHKKEVASRIKKVAARIKMKESGIKSRESAISVSSSLSSEKGKDMEKNLIQQSTNVGVPLDLKHKTALPSFSQSSFLQGQRSTFLPTGSTNLNEHKVGSSRLGFETVATSNLGPTLNVSSNKTTLDNLPKVPASLYATTASVSPNITSTFPSSVFSNVSPKSAAPLPTASAFTAFGFSHSSKLGGFGTASNLSSPTLGAQPMSSFHLGSSSTSVSSPKVSAVGGMPIFSGGSTTGVTSVAAPSLLGGFNVEPTSHSSILKGTEVTSTAASFASGFSFSAALATSSVPTSTQIQATATKIKSALTAPNAPSPLPSASTPVQVSSVSDLTAPKKSTSLPQTSTSGIIVSVPSNAAGKIATPVISATPSAKTTSTSISTSTSGASTSDEQHKAPNIFSLAKSAPVAPSTTTAPLSIFGEVTASTSVPSLFSSTSPTSTTNSSIFGATTPATTGVFAPVVSPVATTVGLFGTVTSSSSLFGAKSAATTAVGTPTTTVISTTSSGGLFGIIPATTATPLTTSSGGLFGNIPATTVTPSTTSSGGLFGNIPATTATPSTTSSGGLFGSIPATTTTPPTTSSGGLFGNIPATIATSSTTSVGLFGNIAAATSPPQTTSSTSLFGNMPSSSPISFGVASPNNSTSLSTTATTSVPTVFGAGAALLGSPSTTSNTGIFSSVATTTGQSPSIFASTSATTTSGLFGSTFGNTATTTSAGVFQSATTPSSPGGFGSDLNQTASLFGQMLGGSSPATAPPSNIFAQKTPTKPAFDSSSSIFGSSTPTNTAGSIFGAPATFGQAASAPLFGATTTSSSIFGQTPTTTSSSFFGQNICSPFGSGSPAPNQSPFGAPSATTQSAFGSSTFGTKPAFGQSVFGQSNSSAIFGGGAGASTTTSSGSIFGGASAGGNAFSSGSFSGGAFSGGGSSIAQSGFGAAATFSKPAGTGFGSAPVFGGSPAGPTFGGVPAFGSTATFGSPTNIFGSTSSPSAPFGQTSGATGFESLANQSTVGFGNLAQMSSGQQGFGSGFSPQQNAFGGQSQSPQQQQQQSPSFGGTSFSSWR